MDTFTGQEVMCVGDRSGDYEGILIPYFEPGTDRIRGYRLRRTNPEVGTNGKPDRKYLTAPGDRNMFYLLPRVAPEWLADTSLRVCFVEGEFKALSLWGLAWHLAGDAAEKPSFLPIGLSGVSNWKGTVGKQDGPHGERQDIKGPIPDFDRIDWQGREVVLVGDSNAFSNTDVRIARLSLAKHLRGLGAHVLFADLDPALGLNGIDDVCGQLGVDAALKIIGAAYDPKRARASGVSSYEYRTPVQHNPPVAPVLRLEALYKLPGDVVNTILPCSETDPATLLLHLLTGFGNLVGRSAFFKVENTCHYPNLNYCAVGDTSRGRKGTAWGQIRPLLAVVDSAWAQSRIQGGLSSGEGLIAAVADQGDKKTDKRLLEVATEFASVLKVMNREGNTLSTVIRDGWDSGNLHVLTKRDPLHMGGAHISLIGHITREELKRGLSETESANGFANRFLWARSQRSKYLPEGAEISKEAIDDLVERLKSAVYAAGAIQQMKRDPEAKELWHSEYKRLSDPVPGLLGAVTSRAEAQVLRLSMIYALLDSSSLIRLPHLQAALAVWDYCFDSARFIFGSALGYPVADEIWNALRVADDAGLSRTQISSEVLGRNHKASDITNALVFLEDKALAHRMIAGEGRNSTEVWYSGPAHDTKTETVQ